MCRRENGHGVFRADAEALGLDDAGAAARRGPAQGCLEGSGEGLIVILAEAAFQLLAAFAADKDDILPRRQTGCDLRFGHGAKMGTTTAADRCGFITLPLP